MKLASIIFLALLTTACPFASDYFTLNKYDKDAQTVRGVRLNGWEKVHKINQNSILLKEGGAAAIAVPMEEFGNSILAFDDDDSSDDNVELVFFEDGYYIFDFGIKNIDDVPLNICLRTSSQDFLIGNKGLRLEIFEGEAQLSFESEILQTTRIIPLEKGETRRVIVINNGKYLKISLDCNEIVNIKTDLPISEYVIFESPGEGSWEINAISFEKKIPEGIIYHRPKMK